MDLSEGAIELIDVFGSYTLEALIIHVLRFTSSRGGELVN